MWSACSATITPGRQLTAFFFSRFAAMYFGCTLMSVTRRDRAVIRNESGAYALSGLSAGWYVVGMAMSAQSCSVVS